ncbi:polysaccharide pyruvyl transferase family protein [Blautia sp. MSJ-19]|uniref:polysaccharide pyruvyl transferase family protein n=1 Tax=Blautia sp. MSJ-19 TaxID=2841517 RepID=UPI001C0F299F|nr:polysaccharide pyruvyl transferase family protein [Blautia sp. MSJ-19]MBU5480120.1 polysaccharide pyruvyl transferase family protein [Blautia sp. MSJ-19]
MSKIAIVTLADFNNYGNRLQNYALEKVLTDMGNTAVSLVPYRPNLIKTTIKTVIKKDRNSLSTKLLNMKRLRNFLSFDEQYVNTLAVNDNSFQNVPEKDYDCFISGSDQVWNPDWAKYTYDKMFLRFSPTDKRISYAASFGVDTVPEEWTEKYRTGLSEFRAVSVREDRAVEIVRELTGNSCEKVLDPTMLLNRSDWDKVKKVPEKVQNENYILTYFLGGRTEELNKTIDSYAKKYHCTVIHLLDLEDASYTAGPDGFVGLISKAKLVLTDSFHATVFSILYERPFVVYGRQGIGSKMGSRLSSLLEMCGLSERKKEYMDEEHLLNCNFETAKKAIEQEKAHSMEFLHKAIADCVDCVD